MVALAIVLIVTQTKEEPEEIKIGAIVPLTGPFAAYGEPVRDGMFLAVEEINAGSGINEKQIKFILEDDAGDPTTAVNAFNKLVKVDKLPIILGPLSSGASMATAPVAESNKVVQISTLAGTIDLTYAGDYVFRIYPSAEVASRYIAKMAIERFGVKRIAIFYPESTYGFTAKRFISEVVKAHGVEVVTEETFKDGDRDFRTQLTKIASKKPDALLCSAYYTEGALILVQAKEQGLNVPILGEDGWFGPIADIARNALKNLYFANVAFGVEYKDNQMMQKFITNFEKRFSKKATAYAATGYDAVYLAKEAIEMGGYDADKIKVALYEIDFRGAFGRIKYDRNGDNIGAIYDLFQLNEKNEAILLK